MKRLAYLALGMAAASGCYLEPINQRPSASIRQLTDGTIFRDQVVELVAVTQDPDGDAVDLAWHAYACTSGVDPNPDCDPQPFTSGDELTFDPMVPALRADGTTPVRALRVLLEVNDIRGAYARPTQDFVIAIDDQPPTLTLRKDSQHGFVVDSHISLFADTTDADDGPSNVTLDWTVFSPMSQPTFALDAISAGSAEPGHRGEGKSFLPNGTGDWDIRVTATDGFGAAVMQDFDIVVGADEPPCIAEEQPIADGSGTLPLFETTQFAVPVVTDDLDSYPPVVGDPDTGPAHFSWTLQTNGGARAPLAVTGNNVVLDPTDFHPGDLLELRVEVSDRQDRSASFAACPDADATCTFNATDTTCTQRQTWQMEVQ